MEILLAIACFGLFAVAGCILPAPFEPEQTSDGGPPAAPNILSGDPAFPGPLTRSATDEQEFTVTLEDANGDPLTVRFFRGWPTVAPPFSNQAATRLTSGEGVQRYTASFKFRPCDNVPDPSQQQIDVVVSDRGFDATDTTFFRRPVGDGRVSIRSWIVNCLTP